MVREPGVSVAGFDGIRDDMMDQEDQLLWKRVLGKVGYQEVVSRFEAPGLNWK